MTKTLSLISAASLLMIAGACTKADDTLNADELARAKRLADHVPAMVGVDRLASLIDDGACAVFDANTESVRKKQGLIPTAAALSHYSRYSASELPASKDTKLVFYCSNEACGASHTAAEKAVLAGYNDVNVLPAGVRGWKLAGNETTAYQN